MMRTALAWLLAFVVGVVGALLALLVVMLPTTFFEELEFDGSPLVVVKITAMMLGFVGGAILVLRHLIALGAGLGGLIIGFVIMALMMLTMMMLLMYAATGWSGTQAIINVAGFGGGGLGATVGFGLAYWFGLARGWRALAWCGGGAAAIFGIALLRDFQVSSPRPAARPRRARA